MSQHHPYKVGGTSPIVDVHYSSGKEEFTKIVEKPWEIWVLETQGAESREVTLHLSSPPCHHISVRIFGTFIRPSWKKTWQYCSSSIWSMKLPHPGTGWTACQESVQTPSERRKEGRKDFTDHVRLKLRRWIDASMTEDHRYSCVYCLDQKEAWRMRTN